MRPVQHRRFRARTTLAQRFDVLLEVLSEIRKNFREIGEDYMALENARCGKTDETCAGAEFEDLSGGR